MEEEKKTTEAVNINGEDNHDAGDENRGHTGDGASPGKIFIGGLARETTSTQFLSHFGKYGEITDSVIMKDRMTGAPRGFGFVTYADSSVVDRVMEDTHIINGKQVEIKRTIPRGAGGSKEFKTKKIFVGGIPTAVTEDELKDFFTKFGEVREHQIMRDHATGRSRGFAFVSFEMEQSVEDLLSNGNHIEFSGVQVEVKKAEPKKPNPPPPAPSKRRGNPKSSFGGGYSDAYGAGAGYGGSAGGMGAGSYRSGGGAYGARGGGGGYSGYGGGDYGGYGGYGGGGGSLGGYRGGEPASLGYSGRYGAGGGYGRGYDMDSGGGGYGGVGEGYGGYGGGAGAGAAGGGYGGGYDGAYGGGGYSGGAATGGEGSFYGSRGGYGAAGAPGGGRGRYHPYSRRT